MIEEIEFGQPRVFLDKAYTVERIRALNIARCGKCGRRVASDQNAEWCDLCLRDTAVEEELNG